MLGCLHPEGPFPILELHGPPGSAKTTTASIIKTLIDPCIAHATGAPRDVLDLIIAARHGWILSLDNLTSIPAPLADAICRLSTGGTHRARQLYSNDGEILICVRRPLIITAVNPVLCRADLRDRSLSVYCPPISSTSRRPLNEVMAEVTEFAPYVLGSLLTALSTSLRDAPALKPRRLPRMADFAKRVMAASPAFGWDTNQFLDDLTFEQREGHQDELAGCPVALALINFMEGRRRWEGTATHLRDSLTARVGDVALRDRSWPADPAAFSRRLNQLAPHLQAVGLRAAKGRVQGQNRLRTLVIERVDGEEQ